MLVDAAERVGLSINQAIVMALRRWVVNPEKKQVNLGAPPIGPVPHENGPQFTGFPLVLDETLPTSTVVMRTPTQEVRVENLATSSKKLTRDQLIASIPGLGTLANPPAEKPEQLSHVHVEHGSVEESWMPYMRKLDQILAKAGEDIGEANENMLIYAEATPPQKFRMWYGDFKIRRDLAKWIAQNKEETPF